MGSEVVQPTRTDFELQIAARQMAALCWGSVVGRGPGGIGHVGLCEEGHVRRPGRGGGQVPLLSWAAGI